MRLQSLKLARFEAQLKEEVASSFFDPDAMDDPNLVMSVKMSKIGRDYVPVEKTAVGFDYPTFEW